MHFVGRNARSAFAWLVVPIVLLAHPHLLVAHPGSDEQLAILAAQIEAQPHSAALYLKRGELHCADGHWDAALADYDRAARYAPGLDVVELARGELFLKANKLHAAERHLNRFLRKHPDHPKALLTRARTLVRLGRGAQAAADFSQAIPRLRPAKPDYYLERAQAQIGAGLIDEAVRGLDASIDQFGPLPVLQRAAIDLERRCGRYDDALQRVDRLAAYSPPPETWLALRGEILVEAGRPAAARAAFEAALAALTARPPQRRASHALQELEQRVRSALDQLATSAGAQAVGTSCRPN